MPRLRNRKAPKGRVTDTDVMIAYAVLAFDRFEERLEAEGWLRRHAEDNVIEDLDEIEDRLARIEAHLPTLDASEGRPAEAAEVADGLTPFEQDRAVLATAVELQLPVEFVYTNGDLETKRRHVSPYELKTTLDGRRFVLGWDHDRNGIRQFQIDKAETRVEATDAVAYRLPLDA